MSSSSKPSSRLAQQSSSTPRSRSPYLAPSTTDDSDVVSLEMSMSMSMTMRSLSDVPEEPGTNINIVSPVGKPYSADNGAATIEGGRRAVTPTPTMLHGLSSPSLGFRSLKRNPSVNSMNTLPDVVGPSTGNLTMTPGPRTPSSSSPVYNIQTLADSYPHSSMPPGTPPPPGSATIPPHSAGLSSSAGSIHHYKSSRKAASVRTLGKTSNETLHVPNGSDRERERGEKSGSRRHGSSSSQASAVTILHGESGRRDRDRDREGRDEKDGRERRERDREKEGRESRTSTKPNYGSLQKIRSTPRLPHDKDVEPAPSTLMYWSRAPVYGTLPTRPMRAHSVTLVDTTAWVFGGCDDKDNFQDIYCFDIETMQWSHPEIQGEECPPPCRAHTATLVDRKLVIIGGGRGPDYYNAVWVFDTVTRRWTKPNITSPQPSPRRAHTAVYYKHKIWVFGGGNGMDALNDLWTLDVRDFNNMRWTEIQIRGNVPGKRGYHTANLVGNVMIVVGGSDGKECFTDIWCLNLDTLVWNQVTLQTAHRRLSHSATQVGSYLFIMGGHNGNEYSSELLLFNLVSLQYEDRTVLGKPPSPRGYHATLLADSRIFLFGGYNGSSSFEDVHILDLAAGAYLPQVTSFNIELQ
ncbi:hypothetical protein AX16_007632 [Volvariella volvacea WC 439]|nr:hypothetical protein AX16_007632 [Volvariella volvacea WC 439]